MKIRLIPYLLLTGLILFLACDDISVLNDEPDDITGVWEVNFGSGEVQYLSIGDDTISFFSTYPQLNCTVTEIYRIDAADQSGFYTVVKEGGSETTVFAISQREGQLHVRNVEKSSDIVVKYRPSDKSIAELAPSCNAGDVFGTWQLQNNNDDLLVITISAESIKVTYYDVLEECYQQQNIAVIDINGEIFTLEDNDPDSENGEQEIVIRVVSESSIEITRTESGQTFTEIYYDSGIDTESLTPICADSDVASLNGQWQKVNSVNSSTRSLRFLEIYPATVRYLTFKGNPNFPDESDCFEVVIYDVLSYIDGIMEIRNSGTQDSVKTLQLTLQDEFLQVSNEGVAETFISIGENNAFLNDTCSEVT